MVEILPGMAAQCFSNLCQFHESMYIPTHQDLSDVGVCYPSPIGSNYPGHGHGMQWTLPPRSSFPSFWQQLFGEGSGHGQAVCFHTDNMGVVAILQKWSANNAVALHLLRCLYFYTAFYRFEYVSQHIPGVVNVVADAISRNNLTLFFSLFPQATRVSIPKPLEDLLVIQQPDWGSSSWTSLFGHTLPAL